MDKAYKILKIDELVRAGEVGGVQYYSRVTFRTATGVVHHINVDETNLTPEKVGPIVEKRAKELDAIMNL